MNWIKSVRSTSLIRTTTCSVTVLGAEIIHNKVLVHNLHLNSESLFTFFSFFIYLTYTYKWIKFPSRIQLNKKIIELLSFTQLFFKNLCYNARQNLILKHDVRYLVCCLWNRYRSCSTTHFLSLSYLYILQFSNFPHFSQPQTYSFYIWHMGSC